MALLCEFLLRLAFGLSAAMATVSPRKVTSGYFRNHLYVVLGLSALAALLARAASPAALPWAAAAAAAAYVGSACWLYEKPRAGVVMLVVTSGLALTAAWRVDGAAGRSAVESVGMNAELLRHAQSASSGLLLGATLAAMLLGHWYLNAPGMALAPLYRLIAAMGVCVALQAAVCGAGLALELSHRELSTGDWLFLALRWSFGIVGVAGTAWMAWRTLLVPNTQSATGILYVAVIGVFVGETMSLLLSAESFFPV